MSEKLLRESQMYVFMYNGKIFFERGMNHLTRLKMYLFPKIIFKKINTLGNFLKKNLS